MTLVFLFSEVSNMVVLGGLCGVGEPDLGFGIGKRLSVSGRAIFGGHEPLHKGRLFPTTPLR